MYVVFIYVYKSLLLLKPLGLEERALFETHNNRRRCCVSIFVTSDDDRVSKEEEEGVCCVERDDENVKKIYTQ